MRERFYPLASVLSLLFITRAAATVFYVDVNSTNPTPPYASWSTAATTLQAAVSLGNTRDLVLVTNGIYQTGSALASGDGTANRVAITRSVMVQSVNGPGVTWIVGSQVPGTTNGTAAVRCVYLGANATLSGFTLTNGATQTTDGSNAGGGVRAFDSSACVSNCIIVGNAAVYGAGAATCTLNNCVVSNNTAQTAGGAYYPSGALNNCLVVGNVATRGGAVDVTTKVVLNNCTLYGNRASDRGGAAFADGNPSLARGLAATNCIILSNAAPISPDLDGGFVLALSHCCTAPAANGTANLALDPLFANPAAGDFHLQPASPCINSGRNLYVSTSTDLDGNPRISGGTVDIGAYEVQNPPSAISYAWLQEYGLPTDGSADLLDADGDGQNTWQEWQAGTDPTDPASVLKMLNVSTNLSGITVAWQSVSNRTYLLQRATSLLPEPVFLTIKSNLTGQAGAMSVIDSSATGAGPYFYRVGVQP